MAQIEPEWRSRECRGQHPARYREAYTRHNGRLYGVIANHRLLKKSISCSRCPTIWPTSALRDLKLYR